jgi:beta-lactamase regulating signal transducer with metallopeptidase domain
MGWVIGQLNSAGEVFVGVAWPMLVQSAVLIALVLSVEMLLRPRVRAALRCWLVVFVLAYLLLIPVLSLSPPSTYWPAGNTAYADPTLPLPASHINAPLSRPITGQSQTITAGVGEQPLRLTWDGTVFVLWIAGLLFTGGLFARRALAACSRVGRSPSANSLMNDVLAYCRERMGVADEVRLKVGEEGTAPVVCGLWRPVIVVPRNLAPTLGSRHLRDVLYHELAHVKRHDLWVNLIQNCVRVLYFYNPLLLILGATLQRLRDEAADETVRETLGNTDFSYTQRLADVAVLAGKQPAPALCTIAVA